MVTRNITIECSSALLRVGKQGGLAQHDLGIAISVGLKPATVNDHDELLNVPQHWNCNELRCTHCDIIVIIITNRPL